MNCKATALATAVIAAFGSVSCGFSGPKITVTRSSTLSPASGFVLMSGDSGDAPAFATDLNGRIAKQYPFDSHSGNYHPIPIQPLSNGNLIVESATGSGIAPCTDCPANNVVLEMDNSGHVVWQQTNQQLQDALTAKGFNIKLAQMSHDAIGLPNGHIIVLASNLKDIPAQSGTTTYQGSVIIDLDSNHQPVWVWDAFDHLDIARHPYFALPDWTHGNAVAYSADDGNLLFSARAQSWIIKIDYQNGTGTGNILWRLGYQGDFTLTNGGPADWFYGQHAPIFLSTNTTGVFQLGMFDNGNSRVLDATEAKCGTSGQPDCYSTVPIFQIDEVNRTATVVWRDKLEFFSSAVGNMQVLDNGDVWFDAGRVGENSIIREVTRDATPQTVLEMKVNEIVYRAIHVPGAKLGIQQ